MWTKPKIFCNGNFVILYSKINAGMENTGETAGRKCENRNCGVAISAFI